jgi:phosphomannomutase
VTLTPGVFKAYDVRGLYPGEIDEQGAARVGRAFVEVTGARRVAVGHDVRLSSPSRAAASWTGWWRAGPT